MREVNFSIPNANKASVGITTALYDRRALDCTSTLPLINSLNNLAYLTTSSGRIRDILTVDGGIERLVCILKEGRSKDMMEMWKWNLAFQCIVNIGVRGSEAVRTRVVEADMVPVIATILDNYFHVLDKCRERADVEGRRKCPFTGAKGFSRSSSRNDAYDSRTARARRHAPPPITIPEPLEPPEADEPPSVITPTAPAANLSLSSPPERTSFLRQSPHHHHHHHHHHRSHGSRSQLLQAGSSQDRRNPEPLQSTSNHPSLGLRPVRDVDRLPSMVPTLHAEHSSQPQSPTTPSAPAHASVSLQNSIVGRQRRRPSIRHQLSISGSDDDGIIEEASEDSTSPTDQPEPAVVGMETDIVMQDIVDEESLLEPQTNAMTLTAPDVSSTDDETFNITHRSAADGSLVSPAATPTQATMGFAQGQIIPPPVNAVNATPPNMQQSPVWYPSRGLPLDRPAPASILAAMPRDEDVLMSLQLLAYVSKYCYLRTYFQKSHLVPRLKIGNDLRLLDPDHNPATHPGPTQEELDEEWDNEFVPKAEEQPYNIFPLIEKFTAKPSSSRHHNNPPVSPQQGDMQYWAGVVMRNLCRKDESRGGIRQCAYWQCGKWEEYTRQFAKCRRCRRTKYCSKECQKGAWGSHRFWCVAAEPGEGEPGSASGSSGNNAGTGSTAAATSGGGSGHRLHHHHHHHHRHGSHSQQQRTGGAPNGSH
ncbi:hypothetical protein BDY17DRAFT_315159 [Neohortaea acidophila]|uniref:MYND-type zinc finger protein samB n=1 Tax=Neohortaea acidophila TaxID=245834 RepID=A0A6A6Q1B7_9PEZI|nr:uncharacterized protein BDY17DRAFT_315159 [Neohortaea acidophila]KAF2486268.1 hypothetical protein BDY17DRAFT_315159 [Neohortaea acidophila]